jgi:hypothetical protein
MKDKLLISLMILAGGPVLEEGIKHASSYRDALAIPVAVAIACAAVYKAYVTEPTPKSTESPK